MDTYPQHDEGVVVVAGRTILRTSVAGVVVALLVAGVSGCGEVDATATAAASSASTPTSASMSSSTATPPSLAPSAAPTGALTFAECPEAKNSGVYDYFDDSPGESWERVVARFVRQSLREQHPDAVPTITDETDDGMVVTFVGPDGRRVARLQLQRMSSGWRPTYDEVCSAMVPAAVPRHY